jgi:hypothetical protein
VSGPIRRVAPDLPAGYVPSDADTWFLDWEEIEARLRESTHYWLASTYPDGRPHVVPRWGVWLSGRFWYDGSPETRHVKNLNENESIALHLESGTQAVIVYGSSRPSRPIEIELGEQLSAEFVRKYAELGYAPGPDAWAGSDAGGMRHIDPQRAIAWTRFPGDLTRFEFDPAS